MSFPLEFVRSTGDYDFITPTINLTINAAIIAIGGISLGVISHLAFKALGFSALSTGIATAIPVTIGAIGIAGAVAGAACFITMGIAVAQFLRNH